MGRILKRRLSAQEDTENNLPGRTGQKNKPKSANQKGPSVLKKLPILRDKKTTTVERAKRMALADKTNRTSPVLESKNVKESPLNNTDVSCLKTSSLITAKIDATHSHDLKNDSATPVHDVSGKAGETFKEVVFSRYKISPIERPVTRSRKQALPDSKKKPVNNEAKRNAIIPKKNRKVSSEANEIELFLSAKSSNINEISQNKPDGSSIENKSPNKLSILTRRHSNLENVQPDSKSPEKISDPVPALKTGTRAKNVKVACTILNKLKEKPARKSIHTPRSSTELKQVVESTTLNEVTSPNAATSTLLRLCTDCEKLVNFCSCQKSSETHASSVDNTKGSQGSAVSDVKKNDVPLPDCTPRSSKSPVAEFSFRKPKTPKHTVQVEKISPGSKSKRHGQTIFSIFKRPDTPRRNSSENKIFTSGSKEIISSNQRCGRNLRPVYDAPMTPLRRKRRRRSSLPREQKEGLYEFEVDESEPKPTKKHRPIMKIQRIRAVKRKKPKVFVDDPETQMRVLRNLDLSPTVFDEMMGAKKKKLNEGASTSAQPPTSTQATESAKGPGTTTKNQNHDNSGFPSEEKQAASSDREIPDCHMEDHGSHDDLYADPCLSSPCSKYGSSTPLQTGTDNLRDSFLDDSMGNFRALSTKCYSPVKSKDSPMPVLLENYNNDPNRTAGDRGSIASNVSVVSDNSVYQNDVDISASTPVKRHLHDSATIVERRCKPVDFNISNCFGFDEPEVMEEPLVSPIKSTICVAPPTGSPVRAIRIAKKKPSLVQPPAQTAPVDVNRVIKQLRFEVGQNSSASSSMNLSVFDDTEISPKKRSPMKRYLQAVENTTVQKVDDDHPSLEVSLADKVPRLSYERPGLRKRNMEQTYLDRAHSEGTDVESVDSHDEDEVHVTVQPKPTKKAKASPMKKAISKKTKGKCMTKKEEEELEKWAKMFNSQCDQVEGYGLCVE